MLRFIDMPCFSAAAAPAARYAIFDIFSPYAYYATMLLLMPPFSLMIRHA